MIAAFHKKRFQFCAGLDFMFENLLDSDSLFVFDDEHGTEVCST